MNRHSSASAPICWVIPIISILLITSAHAQKITPSHVYQSVEQLILELQLIHEADESEAILGDYVTKNRKPRHVLQKSREVYLRVQELREMNGLPKNTVPPFPVTEIKPADVKDLVDKSLTDVIALRDEYFVDSETPKTHLKNGKTPTDVYTHLAYASNLLADLGLPEIVPNNVYQVAIAMISDINLVLAKRGKPTNMVINKFATGKKPADVYQQVQVLLEKLQGFCSRKSSLCPPGGIVIPPVPTEDIAPSNVLDLLNNVLADVGAIKVKAGVTEITPIGSVPSGKTPNDIFDAVLAAQNLVDTI